MRPTLARYLELKGQFLGHDGPLPAWNLDAPIGSPPGGETLSWHVAQILIVDGGGRILVREVQKSKQRSQSHCPARHNQSNTQHVRPPKTLLVKYLAAILAKILGPGQRDFFPRLDMTLRHS